MKCKIIFGWLASFVWLVLLLSVVTPSGRATSLVPPRFETLVDRAELIFTGQATSQHAEWKSIQGQKSIVTFVTFTVEQTHKGRVGSSVTLQFLGGTVGDVTLSVADMPKFSAGERVVLFVEGNGTFVCPLIGFQHGKFTLQKEQDGREIVMKHDGTPLSHTAEIGQSKNNAKAGASAQRGLSHKVFCARVQERLAEGARP